MYHTGNKTVINNRHGKHNQNDLQDKVSNSTAIDKSAIRNYAKKQRSGLTENECIEKSRIIANKLFSTRAYRENSNILLYMAANNEVSTSDIFNQAILDGKKVYFPKVYGKEMAFISVAALDELEKGSFGISEPVSDNIVDITEGLIIMPGVAFDRSCNRIGYGGGFYDRYMEKHTRLASCAICYECQLVDTIPAEPHDKKPEMVITENNVYKYSSHTDTVN